MNTDNRITAVMAIRRARRIAVFTGAGISAESGVPTFRDADGFWKRFPPEKFATWAGLLQTAVTSPRMVVEFVLNVIEPIAIAEPNAAHRAVAELNDYVPTSVITQNIDGLHQDAGSLEVHEVHGSLLEVIDSSTRKIVHRFSRQDLSAIAGSLRKCVDKESSLLKLGFELAAKYPIDWRGRHRPNLVLFGDSLAEPAWSKSCQLVEECDVLLSIGTSGEVYPAAELPSQAAAAGATLISIDPRPGLGCWLKGNAGAVLPALVRDAFGKQEPESTAGLGTR